MGSKTFNTLFLDRDGVINVYRPYDYVKSVSEFIFIDGVLEALQMLSPLFQQIIVITNQRGVGKGLMSCKDLEEIHNYMTKTIFSHQGKIDHIYTCTDINDDSINRKPNIGMALQAKKDFPNIDFSTSWMIGDSLSDILFANNVGIPAILIGQKYSSNEIALLNIQAHYPDLLSFAQNISQLSSPHKRF